MKKTWICVIALLAVCALAVTGCGKKDSEDTEAPGTVTINSVESGELTEFDYMDNNLTPYVTLGNYEGLHGTLAVEKITEARLDSELDALAEQYGHYNEITDRDTVEEGDRIIADYAGTLDGVAFEGGTATEQEIVVQSNSGYIPGFAEAFAKRSHSPAPSTPSTGTNGSRRRSTMRLSKTTSTTTIWRSSKSATVLRWNRVRSTWVRTPCMWSCGRKF